MSLFSVERPVRDFFNVASSLEHKLTVGMSVFLDANPGKSDTQRYKATVQGWKRGSYLLLNVSEAGGRPRIWEARKCVIRFMLEGEVSGFKTTCVRAIVGRLDNLVQFQWPRDVAKVQVRRHQRAHMQTDCRIALPDCAQAQGQISDLSAGGCNLQTTTPLDVDSVVRVTFGLPDGGRVCSRRIRVRSVQALDAINFSYGCQFEREHGIDHSIKMFVARKAANRHGTPIPHHQLLVLAQNRSEFDRVHRSLLGTPVEVVASSGLLDLGARLTTCNPGGILISAEHDELEIGSVIRLIRNTPSCAELPLAVYGGDASQRAAALAAGASIAVENLLDLESFTRLLPGCEEAPAEDESVAESVDTLTDDEIDSQIAVLSNAVENEVDSNTDFAPTGT